MNLFMKRCGARADIFFILLAAFAFIPMLSGAGTAAGRLSPPKDKPLLVVPARPAVLRLAFDLAKMRDITLVAFRAEAGADTPLLHVWTGHGWQYVSFDDFRSLRFVARTPGTIIIIGDDQTVPQKLLQGMNWTGKEDAAGSRQPVHNAAGGRRIERLPTMNTAELINGISPYFQFNPREWKQLADSYGLKLKGANAPQAKQPQAANALRQEEDDAGAAAPAAPAEKSAPALAGNAAAPSASHSATKSATGTR